MPLKFAWSEVMVGPVENGVVVPARAEYSHSASDGSLYGFPDSRESQAANALASFQLMQATGCSSFCENPRERHVSSFFAFQFPWWQSERPAA